MPDATDPPLYSLLLMGGLSTRMRTPKFLLQRPPTHCPLYAHNLGLLRDLTGDRTYMSLRSTQSPFLDLKYIDGVDYVYDKPEWRDIGPAGGLLSAHQKMPDATWLVLAVDFPLVDKEALEQLVEAHKNAKTPVTCFYNHEGFEEPLFAIWTSDALETLKANVADGKTGPAFTVRHLLGRKKGQGPTGIPGYIQPNHKKWLRNANTPDEWNNVVKELGRAEMTVERQANQDQTLFLRTGGSKHKDSVPQEDVEEGLERAIAG